METLTSPIIFLTIFDKQFLDKTSRLMLSWFLSFLTRTPCNENATKYQLYIQFLETAGVREQCSRHLLQMVVAHVARSNNKLTQETKILTATKRTVLKCIRPSLLTMTLYFSTFTIPNPGQRRSALIFIKREHNILLAGIS